MSIAGIILCVIGMVWGIIVIAGTAYDCIETYKERFKDGKDLWLEEES